MDNLLIYPATTPSILPFLLDALHSFNFETSDSLSSDVTHVLLDIPTTSVPVLSDSLRKQVRLIGGKTPNSPVLPSSFINILSDEQYLYDNAAITAECALHVAFQHFLHAFRGSDILLIGWGRISKLLSKYLLSMGANVSVLTHSPDHFGEIAIFGYHPFSASHVDVPLPDFDLIFNTAPSKSTSNMSGFSNCSIIDLATSSGLDGSNIIHANSLPRKMAPRSSAELIAKTLARYRKEDIL